MGRQKKRRTPIDNDDGGNEEESNPGRNFTGIWKHVEIGEEISRGIYSGKCLYCGKEFNRAKPNKTRSHIANECQKCPEDIRRYYNYIIAHNLVDDPNVEDYSIPPKATTTITTANQKKISGYFESTRIEDSRKKEIDDATITAFVSCDLPFRIVKNPFFINLIKSLCPGYDLPSHDVLSGRLLDSQVSRVNLKVDQIIQSTANLTIGFDGWTNPNGSSLWNFVLLTPDRKQFIYRILDLSNNSHTGEFLAQELKKIIEDIGPKKIAAIVSDNGSNVKLARQLISDQYPTITNLRCIAHAINLISKDIIKHPFASHLIKRSNQITRFFKKSYMANSLLKNKMEEYGVVGGGLKTYVETRWTTVYESASSIVRLKRCLEAIRDEHAQSINPSIVSILRSRGFFDDMQHLSNILLPIKLAILEVEGAQATLADCYISLLKIGAAINKLPRDEYRIFRNHCIQVFNNRYKEFEDPNYLLAFFLHPAYKGAGIKFGTFPKIATHAGNLWKSFRKNQRSFDSLMTQLREYKTQKDDHSAPNVYAMPYTPNRDTPVSWWNTCEVSPNQLQRLALRMFYITPSSASCERVFSTLS